MSKKLKLKKLRSVAIVILVLALLGGLGYIIWQNYIQPKKSDTSDSTYVPLRTEDVKVELTESTTDTIHGSGLAVKYPKDWVKTNAGDYEWYIKTYPESKTADMPAANTNPDNVTLTSPDGKVSVIFDVGNRPTLNKCYADDSNVTIGKIITDTIPGYSDYVFAITVRDYVASGSYFYEIGAYKGGDWTKSVKVGDQYCKVGSQGITFKGTNFDGVILAEIKLNDVKDNDKTTLDAVNKAIESDNFNIAQQIIQSLYVKK